jgi:hypothetical protein
MEGTITTTSKDYNCNLGVKYSFTLTHYLRIALRISA